MLNAIELQTSVDGHIDDSTLQTKFEGGKFSTLAQGYWWNMKVGCVCPTGKYASVLFEICQDYHLTDGCTSIP